MPRNPTHKISVPAKPAAVRSFLDGCRARFIQDLTRVREVVNKLREGNAQLSCIYKVYSRGDSQEGDELKNSRKVRLKFDDFNIRAGNNMASLYDIPDIIGFTVVVSYPSDINLVGAAVDQAIDAKKLVVAFPKDVGSSGEIVSKYGRAVESGGYRACHYNVKTPSLGARPICEIQVKTVLHDAWGTKTHDLTFKPSSRMDRELRKGFDLLGDALANLDKHSDALRQSIERASRIRESKRRQVRISALSGPLWASIEEVTVPEVKDNLARLYRKISELDCNISSAEADETLQELLSLFEESPRATSLMLCFLATILDRKEYFEHAQDWIDEWEQRVANDLTCLKIRCIGALAAFSAGQISEAIDIAEEVVAPAEAAIKGAIDEAEKGRAERLTASLYSSLAYYHADRIGSDEGDKRGSQRKALLWLRKSRRLYPVLNLASAGLACRDEAILESLAHPQTGKLAFQALDTEAFVLIQTAQAETELRAARDRLFFLHGQGGPLARFAGESLLDYHDYCGRIRLAELEASRS